MCSVEELMPSVGTSVPSPSLLAVQLCQSDSTLQNIGKICSDVPSTPSLGEDFDNPFDFFEESVIVSKSHMISISDDGKIWNWLLTAEGQANHPKDDKDNDDNRISFPGITASRKQDHVNDSRSRFSNSTFKQEDIVIKVNI